MLHIIPAIYQTHQVPSVQEWATYGTEPGVLVGIIVLGCATIIIGTLRVARWFIVWHTEQLDGQRAAHKVELEAQREVHRAEALANRAEIARLVNKILELGGEHD